MYLHEIAFADIKAKLLKRLNWKLPMD